MQNGNSRVRLQAKWDALRQAGEIIAGINILLRLTGRLKIRNQQNFPKEPEPLLIVANHLSKFVEAILLLPGLFAPWYWRNMCHSAWNTPDRDNFKALRHHSLSWALLRTEFMPRNGNWRQQLAAIDRVAARLRAGESAIFFPEGGRTSSGNGERLYSPMLGKPMRPLVKGGLTRLVLRSQARVLPVWAEGTDKVFPRNALLPRPWRKMALNIGEPLDFSECRAHPNPASKQKVVQVTTDALLALADLPARCLTASVAQAGTLADETA